MRYTNLFYFDFQLLFTFREKLEARALQAPIEGTFSGNTRTSVDFDWTYYFSYSLKNIVFDSNWT